ncbi:hypothetical protein D5274_19085 [bacterium 1XD42-94]|nr:hypothetical protein [bacterium 1XD42-76]NBK07152.1 hypothetical protein [bacterium 1XD42-94]
MEQIKTVRIRNISQLYLLKQINSCLGKREIPKEVIHRMFRIVHSGKLGKKGFLVLCLNKIEDDDYGIEEAVGMYPGRMWLDENMGTIEVKSGCRKKADWYIAYAKVNGQRIYVLYQPKERHN